MIKKIALSGLGLALLAAPSLALAQSTDAQSQIASLLAQIKQLQVLIAQMQGLRGASTSAASCLNIKNNLYLDQSDATTNGEVSKLQQFLGGRMTGYYGPATLQLVESWQSSHGVVSSGDPDTTGYGYVGPKTRIAMGCAGNQAGAHTGTSLTTQTTATAGAQPTATIDQSSLNPSIGTYVITGNAYNTNAIAVAVLPQSGALFNVQYSGGQDYNSVSAFVNQNPGSAVLAPELVQNNRWSLRAFTLKSSYVGTVLVYDASTRALLTTGTLRFQSSTSTPDSLTALLSAIASSTAVRSSTPTCSIVSSPNPASFGQAVTLKWISQNAVSAQWVPDVSGKDNVAVPAGAPSISGAAAVVASVIGNPTVTLKVFAADGTSNTCTATFSVPSPNGVVSDSLKVNGADTAVIPEGGQAEFTWNSTGAVAGCDLVRNGMGIMYQNAPQGGVFNYTVRYQSGETQFSAQLNCYANRYSGPSGLTTTVVMIKKQ